MAIALTEHTTRAFDADLLDLTRMIAEMGGLAERQLIEAVDALAKCDRAHGERVVLADARLDAQQRDIEQKAIATIATRQPMAVDLREIVGILRIANELERIGDLAKNIGKRVDALNGENMPRKALRGVTHMTDLALHLLARRARQLRREGRQEGASTSATATRKSIRCTPRCSASC